MRKSDMNEEMYGVYRVECRRLVGRPGRTWLESVEVEMA